MTATTYSLDESAHPLAGAGHVGAIDLGGTKILASIFAPDGSIVSRSKKMTRAQHGPDVVVERMAEAMREAAAEAGIDAKEIAAVGVGAPGPVDTKAGVVRQAPNLGWENYPLRDELARHLNCGVALGNDVNVAVLAEYAAGAGRGARHVVGIWPGTGVGGGMILDGRMYDGAWDLAGEVGHITIKAGGPRCGCGGRGHLEALCSRTAIVKAIAKAEKRGAKTDLSKVTGKPILETTSGDLARALARGDKVVEKVLNRTAKYLALGVASVANLLNPELVVLGGGVVEALGDPFVEQVTKLVRKQPLKSVTSDLRIVPSQLGDDAGITGAALLARQLSA